MCFEAQRAFSYSCVCTRGYNGYNCELDDNDCVLAPCMNGGVCSDLVDKCVSALRIKPHITCSRILAR